MWSHRGGFGPTKSILIELSPIGYLQHFAWLPIVNLASCQVLTAGARAIVVNRLQNTAHDSPSVGCLNIPVGSYFWLECQGPSDLTKANQACET